MQKNKFFYGWIIVFAAIFLVFLDGLLLYSFGVLLPSIQAKFEMSKAAVNSIFAIRCIVFAFSMIIFGKLIDKHRPEKVIFLGGLITAVGLFLTAYSDTKLTLFLNYGVLTGLGDGAFYVPAVAVVQRWFNKRRDFAVGLVTAGVPISGLIINPLSAWILSVSSLETTLMSLAGITLIFLLPAFLMKQDPKEMGLLPYGGPFPKSDDAESNNWETKEATKKRIINRTKVIEVDGVKISLNLNEEDYDNAYEKMYLREKNIVKPDQTFGWIERCIYGDITSEGLNDQRIKELNSMDMMANSSIFFNREIVIEMQILSCLVILLMR